MSPSTTEHHENNRAFYNRISKAYDFISDSNEHKAHEAGESALGLQPGEQVLELGFGTGNSVINLARAVSPGGKVCGIDISQGMLQVARDKIAEAGLSDAVELQVADARDLPFADNRFDAAFTSFTLELFPPEDIPIVLQQVRRVLKPGGHLGVVSMATVKQGEHDSLLESTYKFMHRHFPHIVDCRPIDVEQVLTAGGFQISKQIEMEIWTMPVRAVIGTNPG